MNCPRCKVSLLTTEVGDVSILCCKKCAGILLNQRNLNSLLKMLCSRVEHKIDANTVVDAISDLGPIEKCPKCDSAMENYGYMESNKVFIDYCDECNSLWLDSFEILTMIDMYAVSNNYREYLKKSTYEGADLMVPYANSQAAMTSLVWSALNIMC